MIQTDKIYSPESSLDRILHRIKSKFIQLWFQCDSSFPAFTKSFTVADKLKTETQFNRLMENLGSNSHTSQKNDEISANLFDFAQSALGIQKRYVEVFINNHFVQALSDFAKQAREFDSALSDADIYQAGRNAWTMNYLQLLFSLPVELTPAIFAYSMLYPYTDNYLDDPQIPIQDKIQFNQRFALRLAGHRLTPQFELEQTVYALVAMIERQYGRSQFPHVYESLLSIHAAQCRSLTLLHETDSINDTDILDISFEKGGTSVVADGYLVVGKLNISQIEFLFGYGAYLQLADDLQDVTKDCAHHVHTLFTRQAESRKLDQATNRLLNFGHCVFDFLLPANPQLDHSKEMLQRGINLLIIEAIFSLSQLFSQYYIDKIELYSPFRSSFLKELRNRLYRKKSSTSTNSFLAPILNGLKNYPDWIGNPVRVN